MKQIQASVIQTLDSSSSWWNKLLYLMENDLYDAGGSVIHLLNYWGQIIMSACYDEHEVGQLALFSSNPCEIVILVNFYSTKYSHSLLGLLGC